MPGKEPAAAQLDDGDVRQVADVAEAAAQVHLDEHLQLRNARIFAALVSLIYLAAPVLYVGFVQAALFKRLQASDTIANLPSTAYLALAGFPVVITWLIPQARLLKPTLCVCYAVTAMMGLVVALVLVSGAPSWVMIAAVVAHGAVLGCSMGVGATFNWEALGRGVSEKLRGKALAMAYGVGPLFAVVGSLGSQLVVNGELFGWAPQGWPELSYPYNFAALFAASFPIMGVGAFLAHSYRIPLPKRDVERESFTDAVWGGFKQVVGYRILLIACIAYLLVYCGNMVQNNMSLFTQEAVGRPPEDLVGYQNALRFSFKMLAGFLLGWVLTKSNPKIPLLITAGLQIAGVLWVLFVPGYWFLLAFGINGAGELFGVYYFNYPLCCSAKSHMRRNIAFLMLISTLVAVAPVMYGAISDRFGLRASFYAALAILVFTTGLVWRTLPRHPRPRAEDLTEADLAAEALEKGGEA